MRSQVPCSSWCTQKQSTPLPPQSADPPTPTRRIELRAAGDWSSVRKSPGSVVAVVRAQLSYAIVSRSITCDPFAMISIVRGLNLDFGARVRGGLLPAGPWQGRHCGNPSHSYTGCALPGPLLNVRCVQCTWPPVASRFLL